MKELMGLLSVSSVLSVIGSVALAILILLIMITVHEFGHYLAGKALKFKINEFAIGFGPKLFKRKSKKSGELFSVRLLPLGGFCAFEDEEGTDGEENKESFISKPPWKRIIVLLAGPVMNYVLALLLIIVSMFAFGQQVFKVGSVDTESENAAIYAEHSLDAGDMILEVNGKRVYLITDMMSALKGKAEGEVVPVLVSRGGEEVTADVMLRSDCDFESSSETSKLWRALGVGTVIKDGTKYWDVSADNYRLGFFQTIGSSFVYSFKIAGTIFKVLGELLTGHLGLSAMGGPVTTIKLTSEIATQSLQSFLEIAAYIGVNLAVFNLLPIPALDGSKIVFCLIEWVFRKPVPRKIEAVIHSVGFILILVFAVLVDILQFVHC